MNRADDDSAVFPACDPRASACPVCASEFVSFVRRVMTRRTKRLVPLHFCMDCASFWCSSGYREDEAQLARDLEWGKGVADRNRKAGDVLFANLKSLGVACDHVVEVGCGIGVLLDVARRAGSRTLGFDVNRQAIDYGRATFGLDLRADLWRIDDTPADATLIMSISTLEHILEPRPLVFDLSSAARKTGAALFISVPLVDRDKWPMLKDADPYTPGTWLFDNDVHVTHFSSQGLERLIDEAGAKSKKWLRQGMWHGVVARFD